MGETVPLRSLKRPDESPATRARILALEAQAAAAEHIETGVATLKAGMRFCEEAAEGGESWPIGVREWARQERDRMAQRLVALDAIIARGGR